MFWICQRFAPVLVLFWRAVFGIFNIAEMLSRIFLPLRWLKSTEAVCHVPEPRPVSGKCASVVHFKSTLAVTSKSPGKGSSYQKISRGLLQAGSIKRLVLLFKPDWISTTLLVITRATFTSSSNILDFQQAWSGNLQPVDRTDKLSVLQSVSKKGAEELLPVRLWVDGNGW